MPILLPDTQARDSSIMKQVDVHVKGSESLRRKTMETAREFRKQPTPSEAILWSALRGRRLNGIKFRRQQPVGSFIVDFYNSEFRLAVEVDGHIHKFQQEADRAREEFLEDLGLSMLRLQADRVEKDLPAALEIILAKVREIKSRDCESPAPILGEGTGERELGRA
jgi:very-short-patch-repair endonuclease